MMFEQVGGLVASHKSSTLARSTPVLRSSHTLLPVFFEMIFFFKSKEIIFLGVTCKFQIKREEQKLMKLL